MKKWTDLTDIEKREAIARRLGWEWVYGSTDKRTGWMVPDNPAIIVRRLPDWPTNDALAFTEVWPKILEQPHQPLVLGMGGYGVSVNCPSVHREDDYAEYHWEGNTWADAICHA